MTQDDVDVLVAGGAPRGVLARGLGRSYGDAAQNAGGRVIDMTRLGAIEVDADRGEATVDAGASLDALLRRVVPLGWTVPVSPGTRHVTVGGAIASDVHGKNHHRDGAFSAHVRRMELVTPALGRVVLEPGDDAFAATAGGMGLTGVVARATLSLLPIETSWMRVRTRRATSLEDAMASLEDADRTARYSVAWVDCLATGARLGRGVVSIGEHASLSEVGPDARREPLAFTPRSGLGVPFAAPRGMLNGAVARAFNEAWFRGAPARAQTRLEPMARFFHPLDGVREWNRLYGAWGFVQYQFAVPFGAESTVRTAIATLARAGCPSFLAVLKRFGPGTGLLSFPIAGWTLALDVPASTPGLARVLDELDDRVGEAGGRVYLSKDARTRASTLAAMYPELPRWREIRDRLDPDRTMTSDLDRRLGLVHRDDGACA